jgi:hypothetical protein
MSRRERIGMKQRFSQRSVSLYLSAVMENAARFFSGLFLGFLALPACPSERNSSRE